MFLSSAIEYKAPWIKKLIFIILVNYIFLYSVVDIDIRRKILKFNALRFNGSKYKEESVLPQF
jgi:hypothetical protein